MTKVQAIFTTAIDFIGKDRVSGLLRKFGCDEEPTAEVCMEVLNREGKAFSIPFGKMMQAASKTPRAKAIMLKAAKMNKATGNGSNTEKLTAEQKSQMGLNWFNAIGGFFAKGLDNVDDIINAVDGTNKDIAQAQLMQQNYLMQDALNRREEASQKKTLYWILGGIGVLVIVMIFVIALAKRS